MYMDREGSGATVGVNQMPCMLQKTEDKKILYTRKESRKSINKKEKGMFFSDLASHSSLRSEDHLLAESELT